MVDLKPHNLEAYGKIKEIFKTNNRACCIQPTGSGKSYLALKLFEDNPSARKLVLEPQHYIREQLQAKVTEDMGAVQFITYSKLSKMSDEEIAVLEPDIIVLDEFHRAGASIWGDRGVKRLLDSYPESKVLGLSATPIRYLDNGRNMAEELFDGAMANNMNLAEAIVQRILPVPRYICGLYRLDGEVESINKKIEQSYNNPEEKKILLKQVQEMKKQLDKSNGVSSILRKYILEPNGKYIVFCKDIKHLNQMKPMLEQWFDEAGFENVRMYIVHSKNANKDTEFKKFTEDDGDGIRLCLVVSMLNEGVHVDGIDGVIMLRNTISAGLFFQQIGRAISCNSTGIPLILDLVANAQSVTECNLKTDVEREILKEKKRNKGFSSEGLEAEKFFIMDEVLDVISAFKRIEERLIDDYNDWTEKEINILRHFFPLIGGREIIKQNMLPRHTLNSVKVKAYKLNLRLRKRGKYIPNKTDDKVLIENYKNLGKKGILKLLPHMTENQVRHRAKQLGLYFDDKKWTENEIRLLNKYYSKIPIEELVKRLNRSKKSIITKACKQGLTSDRSVIWTKEEDNRLALLYPKLGPRIFDEFPGKTRNQLQKRLGILNIEMDNPFETKMQLARQVISEGVILDCKNQYYQNVNLYAWKIYNKDNFTNEDMEIIERLIPYNKRLISIRIIDLEKNSNSSVYFSISEAAKVLHRDFGIGKTEKSCITIIRNRLTGKVKNPVYKGRFIFQYADTSDQSEPA